MKVRIRMCWLLIPLVVTTGCREASPDRSAVVYEGFVVWESNRSGAWRIYKQDLGTDETVQLSPEEAGRDHVAAHVSPDGTRVLYLSYPSGVNGYRKQPTTVRVPMWMIDLEEGGAPEKLMSNVRPYGEHRAAVWLSDQEFAYIDHKYRTQIFDLQTRKSRMFLHQSPEGGSWDHGFLPSPSLQHVTTGLPQVFEWVGVEEAPALLEQFAGCQPLFTRDGDWFYYMGGMGGPIRSMNLTTGDKQSVLEKEDSRLPEGRGYLYFPHVSPDRTLMVYAASDGSHDHHRSDYDLFLIPLDPKTLEVSGEPLRLTEDPATDRFPELWRPAPFPSADSGAVTPQKMEGGSTSTPFLRWHPAQDLSEIRLPGRENAEKLQSRRTGLTRYQAHGALLIGQGEWILSNAGVFLAEPEGGLIQMSLELKQGAGRHVLFRSGDPEHRLVVRDSQLQLLGANGDRFLLYEEIPFETPMHLAVQIRSGGVQAFVNGNPGPDVKLTQPFTEGDWGFGADESEDVLLKRLEWSPGVITEDEVLKRFQEVQAQLQNMEPVERKQVRVKLVERTTPPTLEEITPYRESLVLNEYQLIEGEELAIDRFRVWQWAFLDGLTLEVPELGQEVDLVIEPKSAHPWVETLNRVDDLSFSVDHLEWMDVSSQRVDEN